MDVIHNQGRGFSWSLLFLPHKYEDNVFVSNDGQGMELRVTEKNYELNTHNLEIQAMKYYK